MTGRLATTVVSVADTSRVLPGDTVHIRGTVLKTQPGVGGRSSRGPRPTSTRSGCGKTDPVWAVTLIDCQPCTYFGGPQDRDDITKRYPGCSLAAIDAVCQAWQFTIRDLFSDRNTLWSALLEFAESHQTR